MPAAAQLDDWGERLLDEKSPTAIFGQEVAREKDSRGRGRT